MANKIITVTTIPTRTGDTVASYNAYTDAPSAGTLIGTLTPAEAAAGKTFSLTDGLHHDVTVKTVWATAGESTTNESNVVIADLTTIAAPTSLAAGTPTSTTIPLTWVKSITGVMTEYRVYDDGVLLQTFTGDVAAGTLTGLTASTTYTNLTVRAFDGTTESADSNAVNGTTAAGGDAYPTTVYTSDFATSLDTWVGTRITLSQVNGISDGTTSEDGVLKAVPTGSQTGNRLFGRASTSTIGQTNQYILRYYIPTGEPDLRGFNLKDGTGGILLNKSSNGASPAVIGTWTDLDDISLSNPTQTLLYITPTNASGSYSMTDTDSDTNKIYFKLIRVDI